MEDLENFLENNGLGHLGPSLIDQQITLDLLCEANEQEITQIFPKIADKIKFRLAMEKLRNNNKEVEKEIEVEEKFHEPQISTKELETIIVDDANGANQMVPYKPFITPAIIDKGPATGHPLFDQSSLSSTASLQELVVIPGTSKDSSNITADIHDAADIADSQSVTPLSEWSFTLNTVEIIKSSLHGSADLRQILSCVSIGKVLLAKAEKAEKLNSRDRSLLVKIVVEAEINSLDEYSQSIKKDVWLQRAKEVADLFVGENADVYYMPYKVVEGKVIQASGLFHNRLISHRRYINSAENKKRRSSSSSDSSDSGVALEKKRKRIRPLPNHVIDPTPTSTEANIEWLKSSSNPKELLVAKWKATIKARQDLISTSNTIREYFSLFPGLYLPEGYELLTSDFNTLYPDASKTFEENFPLIKTKLLILLTEKSGSVKPDPTVLDLLNLASVSEEHANIAAFLSITSLLRQMPTITVPRKKIWKLSRDEVRSAFLARVPTAADIDKYCTDREAFVIAKGIPEQPYIIAVGASWATVTQYEVVVFKGLRYQRKTICEAVATAYHIIWALDCAYSKDSAPCWMFVQRTMFDMVSKFDTEGVPLRELLFKVK